ncbi:UNVERIFIED_CONTAM: hypothetical protein Sradi_4031300 [Sesamum radiatum]|uniref:Uncharacterized protein n=1 Tax=Sesamum radiatum TaxID=300843 RepID=A0AAW2PJE3_SESRA
METINSTICGSQPSGAGSSSQLETGGETGSQGINEQVPTGPQQDRYTPVDFAGTEATGHQTSSMW